MCAACASVVSWKSSLLPLLLMAHLVLTSFQEEMVRLQDSINKLKTEEGQEDNDEKVCFWLLKILNRRLGTS